MNLVVCFFGLLANRFFYFPLTLFGFFRGTESELFSQPERVPSDFLEMNMGRGWREGIHVIHGIPPSGGSNLKFVSGPYFERKILFSQLGVPVISVG